MNNSVNLDNVVVEDANEMAIEQLKNTPKEKLPEGVVFDGHTCVDCDDPIDADRLRLVNTYRCSDCIPYYWKEQRALGWKGSVDHYED